MPKRTNAFQRLIYFLRLHLAEGMVVNESEELEDRYDHARREVDIVIHGNTTFGGDVVVSVECRDRKRRADRPWVDEMHAKHERLATDVLYLASSSGFTAGAVKVAELYGIRLITPGEPEDDAGREIVGRLSSLWAKTSEIRISEIDAAVVDPTNPDKPLEGAAPLAPTLFDKSGTALGTVQELAQLIIETHGIGEAGRDATGAEERFTMIVTHPGYVIDQVLHRVFLDVAVGEEQMRALVESLTIRGPAKIVVTQVPLQHGQVDSVAYSYGEAVSSQDQEVSLFVVEEKGSRRITFRVGSHDAISVEGR